MVPKKITKKIDSILVHYWWKDSCERRSLCWTKRTKLELPKGLGGVGLRSVESFNRALLVKQAFRIHNSPMLLLSKVMTATHKRSPIEVALNNNIQSNASWGYKGLVKGTNFVKQGIGRAISMKTVGPRKMCGCPLVRLYTKMEIR